MKFVTKLSGEPCSQLPLDLVVRYEISTIDVMNALLNGRHKLHAISNLIDRSIIGKILNRLKDKLFLAHSSERTTPFAGRQHFLLPNERASNPRVVTQICARAAKTCSADSDVIGAPLAVAETTSFGLTMTD